MSDRICICPPDQRQPNKTTLHCTHCDSWCPIGRPADITQLARQLTDIAAICTQLMRDYWTAQHTAFTPGASSGSDGVRYGTRNMGDVDPTGAVVVDIRRNQLRDAMAIATKLVDRANRQLVDADHLLRVTVERLQPAGEHTRAAYHDQIPPSEMNDQIVAARQAQARRRARGEL